MYLFLNINLLAIFNNEILVSTFITVSSLLLLGVYQILVVIMLKIYKKIKGKGKRIKFDTKFLFIYLTLIFLGFFYIEILLNMIRSLKGLTFFTLFLDMFFLNIGFCGIIGILTIYYSFKKNKGLLYSAIVSFIRSHEWSSY